MRYGIQLTHWLEKAEECEDWFKWLERRGIPVAVIELREKYAVFRMGKVQRRTDKNTSKSGYRTIEAEDTRVFGVPAILARANGYDPGALR